MPNSRNEDILTSIIDGSGSQGLSEPQSREEALLMGVLDKMDTIKPDPAQVEAAVEAWLDNHPEIVAGVTQEQMEEALYPVDHKVKPVTEGGTGATTAVQARTNLSIAANFVFSISMTLKDVCGLVYELPVGYGATIYAGAGVAAEITGDKLSSGITGIVIRNSATSCDFMVNNAAGGWIAMWRFSDLTSTTATIGPVYKFTGTVIT